MISSSVLGTYLEPAAPPSLASSRTGKQQAATFFGGVGRWPDTGDLLGRAGGRRALDSRT
ncbi:unnamed protein product [Nesidiocoris tenuis]|uniref:Uncharacterized protein n=1 Tax=Nesidiocoris tenuis TaxID=355587 RepID=A0A6H5GCT7_9HEMI|nr:unnamed protein product [Nesidiocoris tenuis]